MRCNSIVKYKTVGKKNPKRKVEATHSPYYQIAFGWTKEVVEEKYGIGDIEICDGELDVDIRAIEEPHYGGYTAAMEVNIKCKKCGNESFGINALNINKIFKKLIAEIDQEKINDIFREEAEQQKKNRAIFDSYIKKNK